MSNDEANVNNIFRTILPNNSNPEHNLSTLSSFVPNLLPVHTMTFNFLSTDNHIKDIEQNSDKDRPIKLPSFASLLASIENQNILKRCSPESILDDEPVKKKIKNKSTFCFKALKKRFQEEILSLLRTFCGIITKDYSLIDMCFQFVDHCEFENMPKNGVDVVFSVIEEICKSRNVQLTEKTLLLIEEKKLQLQKIITDYNAYLIFYVKSPPNLTILQTRNQIIDKIFEKYESLKKFEGDIKSFDFGFQEPSCEIIRWVVSTILIGYRNDIYIDYKQIPGIDTIKKKQIKRFFVNFIFDIKIKKEFGNLISNIENDGFI